MTIKHIAPIIAAGIISLTALSTLWTVNIEHHLHLPPQLDFSIIEATSQFHLTYPWKTTKYDINIKETIGQTMDVLHIIQVLQKASYGDVIVFHLAGYGGEVDTVVDLINNIHETKAFVIMDVEAPVYSGHAYLALSGDKLIMNPYTFLMLHESSVVNEDCSTSTGVDRGVSNIEHCEAAKTANTIVAHNLISALPLVTPEEKTLLFEGHDVYLHANELNQRQKLEN